MKRLWSDQRGFAFLSALATIIVAFTMATAVLHMAETDNQITVADRRMYRALYQANGGIEDGIERLKRNPWSWYYPLFQGYPAGVAPRGQYIRDGFGYAPGEYEFKMEPVGSPPREVSITSIGYGDGMRRTIVTKIKFELPKAYQQGIYGRDGVNLGNGRADITGDVWSDADLQASRGNITVNGSLYAANNIYTGNNTSVSGTINPNSDLLGLPAIDFNYLRSIATQVYTQSSPSQPIAFSGSRVYNEDIIFVDGDLNLDSLFVTGRVTFVATGNLTITGPVTQNDPSVDRIGVLAGGDCKVRGSGWGGQPSATSTDTVRALIHCLGEVLTYGNTTFYGALVGRYVDNNGFLTLYKDDQNGMPAPGMLVFVKVLEWLDTP